MGGQSETETELTKREGEAAGNKLLVEQALESREVRGTKGRCEKFTGKKRKNCEKKGRNRKQKNRQSLKRKRMNQRNENQVCKKGQKKKGKKCVPIRKRKRKG